MIYQIPESAAVALLREIRNGHDAGISWLVWRDKIDAVLAGQGQAGLTDSEIESEALRCGGRWNGDTWSFEDADLHPFCRTIAAKAAQSQQAAYLATPPEPGFGPWVFDSRKDALKWATADCVQPLHPPTTAPTSP